MSQPVFNKLFRRLQAFQEGTVVQQPIKIEQNSEKVSPQPRQLNQLDHKSASNEQFIKPDFDIPKSKEKKSKTFDLSSNNRNSIDGFDAVCDKISHKKIKSESEGRNPTPIAQVLQTASRKPKLEEEGQEMLEENIMKLKTQQFGDEKFRRSFVLKILDEFASQETHSLDSTTEADKIHLLKREAKTIGLNVLDAKNWMIAYRIAFEIEDTLKDKCNQNEDEYLSAAKRQIAEKLKDYSANNPEEKKYSLIKVQVTIFKALGLMQSSPGIWFNENILGIYSNDDSTTYCQKQYRGSRITDKYEWARSGGNSLNPSRNLDRSSASQRSNGYYRRGLAQEDFEQHKYDGRNSSSHLVNMSRRTHIQQQQGLSGKYQFSGNPSENNYQISKRDRMSAKIEDKLYESREPDFGSFSGIFHEESAQHSQTGSQGYQQRRGVRESRLSSYPINFKVKVAEKLDQLFANFIENILSSRAKQICVTKTQLREIYEDFGTFSFDRKIYLSIASEKLRRSLEKETIYEKMKIDKICCGRVTPEELKGLVKGGESDEQLRPASSQDLFQNSVGSKGIARSYSPFRNHD